MKNIERQELGKMICFRLSEIKWAWGGGIFDIDVSTWEVVIDEGDQIQ